MLIERTFLGQTNTGDAIYRFKIANSSGAYVELSNWGARWTAASVPDFNGRCENVIIGPRDFNDLIDDSYYMGAVVGRFANRIANASFTIDDKPYILDKNDGNHTNHGGFNGFDKRAWDWVFLDDGICFSIKSPDGDGGYPGNLTMFAEYRWNDSNELSLTFRASTDKATFVNPTNHAYFNLDGIKSTTVLNHILRLNAKHILDTSQEFIPSGKIIDVENTEFDFRQEKAIGHDINAGTNQLKWNRGYNHCYVLKNSADNCIVEALKITSPLSRRTLSVWTSCPSVLLYSAGYYKMPSSAICFETQYYPDTPSHHNFPSCLLRPGEVFTEQTIFRFGSMP